MPTDLGFDAPATRRDLGALRDALRAVRVGADVEATFRTAEHGRFAVSGPVRHDVTGTTLKVGWSDLTTGAGTDPVPELQVLVPADGDREAGRRHDEAQQRDELEDVIAALRPGDVVTAAFAFEGAGAFTVRGAVRRDDGGIRWVLAGHHVARGASPAARLRSLTIDRAAPLDAGGDRYDLFGS